MTDRPTDRPRALVLFDGAGLAARGLRLAGFHTTGIELDPVAHHCARVMLDLEEERAGEPLGDLLLGSVLDFTRSFLHSFDAIWASPPCQSISSARTQGPPKLKDYAQDLLSWSLEVVAGFGPPSWVENVTVQGTGELNAWGSVYNAAQFGTPQNRNRVIGGDYPAPRVLHPYQKTFPGLCPAILATEHKGSASDTRRASRWYGRRLTLEECAYHMDLPPEVVKAWRLRPMRSDTFRLVTGDRLTEASWRRCLYRMIGNGVPIRMAQAFGAAAFEELTT